MLDFMGLFNIPTFKHEPQCRHVNRNEMSQGKKDRFIEEGRLFRETKEYWAFAELLCPYTRNSKEEYFWLRGFLG
ncbi:MAG: hypothetical protein ACC651_17395 [Candidatus Scalindua sp.]